MSLFEIMYAIIMVAFPAQIATSVSTYLACLWLQRMPDNEKEKKKIFNAGPMRTAPIALSIIWVVTILGYVGFFTSTSSLGIVLGFVAVVSAAGTNALTTVIALAATYSKMSGRKRSLFRLRLPFPHIVEIE